MKAHINATDAEIDAAIAAGKAEESRGVARAVAVAYRNEAVEVKFQSGVQLIVPVKLLRALKRANESQLRRVTIMGENLLHWPGLDVQYYVPDLVRQFAASEARAGPQHE